MQNTQQKKLQNIIELTLKDGRQSLHQNAEQIVKLVSHRVDMPKHLIAYLSKKLAVKQQDKISLIFDILWFVTEKYENKIALFNQISANKEFLFKISSILSLKELSENLKIKIIDIVYQWKDMFKDNKELFPNFWTFYQTFEKKGFVPSNLNFQTRYQQQTQSAQTVGLVNGELKKPVQDKNIFDLLDEPNQALDFNKIEKGALVLLYKVLQLIELQNKIISNTSPQILDVPPILRQNMSELKINEEKINKFISQHKNKVTIDTSMSMIKCIHLTQKRYTELVTKYLPQKFELSQNLRRFEQYCKSNETSLNQLNKQIDLIDINNNSNPKGNHDLLDLEAPSNHPNSQQMGIKNFFGNMLNKINSPPPQLTLSNKPIEDDFKTDMDFINYKDPKTLEQHYDYVRNLTAKDLFKF